MTCILLLQSLCCYGAISFGLWLKDKTISWTEGWSLSLIINTLIIKPAPPWKSSMATSNRDSICLVSSRVTMDTGFTVQNNSHCKALEVQLIKLKCHFSLVIEQSDSLGWDNTSTNALPYRGEHESRMDKRMALKWACRGIKVFTGAVNVSRSRISWWKLLFHHWKHPPGCSLVQTWARVIEILKKTPSPICNESITLDIF